MTLKSRLLTETEAKISEAQKHAETRIAIAEAFDAIRADREDIPLPWIVHPHRLYGSVGMLSFKETTPDVALRLMEVFPPEPTYYYRDRGTVGFKPGTALPNPLPDTLQVQLTDGFRIRVDKYDSSETVKLEWYTRLGQLLVEFALEMTPVFDVLPRITADVSLNPDGSIAGIRNCEIKLPITGPTAVTTVRYAAGSHKSFNPFVLWSPAVSEMAIAYGISALVAAWVSELNRRGIVTRQAYEHDKAQGLTPESERTYHGLQSGTRTQHACLNTEAARKDWALAKKHWPQYVEDHATDPWPVKPNVRNFGADHYAWACNWLAKHDLYEVLLEGHAYKYGHRWLQGD